MESKSIEFLNPSDFRVIEVVGPKWNQFTGYIPYERNLDSSKYDLRNEDQLGGLLKNIEGGTRKEFTIQLYPLIPFGKAPELAGKPYKAYPITFSMRLHLGSEREKIKHINDYLLYLFDYQTIDDVIKTINPHN